MARKRWQLVLGILIVLALVAVGCAGGSQPAPSGSGSAPKAEPAKAEVPKAVELQPVKLKFGYFPAFHTIVLFVADKGGFFAKQKLDVEMIFVQSGALQRPMLLSGEVEVTSFNVGEIASAAAQGKEVIHIFPSVSKMSMNFVGHNDKLKELGITPQDPLDKKIKALGKMKIGFTTPNAPTDQFTRYYLRKAGYDPDKDVTLVAAGSPANLIAAVKSKQIDAFMLTPPSPNQVEVAGYGTIFIKPSVGEVPEFNNYPYTGFAVRKDWAQKNEDVITRFVQAAIEASRFAKANPDKTREYVKAYFPDMNDQVLEAGMKDMLPSLPDDGRMTEDYVKSYLKMNLDMGIIENVKAMPSTADGVLWTNKYIEEALKRMK